MGSPSAEMGLLEGAMEKLSQEVRELSGLRVTTHYGEPSPLSFYREYVSPGRPCIFTSALPHWRCFHRWSNKYLVSAIGEAPVTVALTPNGRADAPADGFQKRKSYDCFVHGFEGESTTEEESTSHGEWFVTPHETIIKFSDFVTLLETSRHDSSLGVPYAQKQNGSFLEEYGALVDDTERHIPWATEAFGSMPDAVNFWMGDERAMTWLHKDHYENIYVVVAGEKHFTLYPPVDSYRMYTQEYNVARYWQPPVS